MNDLIELNDLFGSEINGIKRIIESNSWTEDQIHSFIDDIFNEDDQTMDEDIKKTEEKEDNDCHCSFMVILKSFFWITLIGTLIASHRPSQKIILRYSQDFIYPVMRQLRLISLPIISKHEQLTDWYNQQCLVNNPFYHDDELECWPCEDVKTLVDLTHLHNYNRAYVSQEKPFLVKDVYSQILTLKMLQDTFLSHAKDLKDGTADLNLNGQHVDLYELIASLETMLTNDSRVYWKMNRVSSARVLRKLVPRPYFAPTSTEVSLQRYIFIDGPAASQYHLPQTEFANVWLVQGQGNRLLVLDPSNHCKHNCSSISFLLQPLDVIYYNSQFYRPRSLPYNLSNQVSLTYMGCFY